VQLSRASNEGLGPGESVQRTTRGELRLRVQHTYPNPMPSKAALRYLGINVGQCRLPHSESDDTLDADAAKVVAALQHRVAKDTVRVTFLGVSVRSVVTAARSSRRSYRRRGRRTDVPRADDVRRRPDSADFRWLIERRDRVDAIVLTHGHEDHTGALRYLVKDINVPSTARR